VSVLRATSRLGENMPQLPPADGVTRAVLQFRYDTQVCANVLHFVAADGVDAPDPTELASRLVAKWKAQLQPFMPATVILDRVIVTDLSASGPPPVEFTTGLPAAGSGGTIQLPNNVTLAFTLRTAFRGRSFRGRVYHVGISEAAVTGNVMSGSALDQALAFYTGLIALAGDVGEPIHKLVVLSYFTGGAVRPSPVATPVTSISTDGVIDSQRRRLPGR